MVIKQRYEAGWWPSNLQLNQPGFSQPVRPRAPVADPGLDLELLDNMSGALRGSVSI